MQSIDSLFAYIQPEVPSCPVSMVRNAIKRAAIEFCEATLAHRVTEEGIPIVNGIAVIEIDTPSSEVRPIEVLNVWASNRELIPKNMTQITELIPDWQTSQGDPAYYNQPSRNEIRVYPIPADQIGATLTIRAAFAPLMTATKLDDDLAILYAEAISAKAKAILMLPPGNPWSSPQLAAFYANDFLARCDTAKIEMLHDRTQGSLRVSPRSFY